MSAVLAASTAPQRVEQTPGKRALRRLLRRRTAVFGLVVVVLMALLALFAPLVAPFDPLATSFARRAQGAERRALVRHRRGRPRPAGARDLRRRAPRSRPA